MARLSGNQVGALWMLASVLSFTVEAALIKSASSSFTPVQILFWRQAVAVVLLAPLVLRAPRASLSTSLPGTVIFRSLIGVLGIVMSISAISLLPLADATTLSFTRVLWIALIAVLVMKEAMGPRRVLAVLLGFVGVAVLMKPGGDGFDVGWPHLIALGAALFAALSILSVKRLTRDHSVLTISAYGAGLGLILSLPFVVSDFRWPDWHQLPILLGLGTAGLCTLVCYTRGMQLGEAVVMAPIDYLRLVLAAGVGLLIFHEPLTIWLGIGAGFIVISNLLLSGAFARKASP